MPLFSACRLTRPVWCHSVSVQCLQRHSSETQLTRCGENNEEPHNHLGRRSHHLQLNLTYTSVASGGRSAPREPTETAREHANSAPRRHQGRHYTSCRSGNVPFGARLARSLVNTITNCTPRPRQGRQNRKIQCCVNNAATRCPLTHEDFQRSTNRG